ncbi:glucose-1-phosphate adenylyltransferase [bacterium]|nr:glucose-1-phosphate adenylyltransferase [candidate division CSSED10-310 bacterium]
MNLPPVCMILAGGQGSRLNALAWHRAKPAVPFAGIFRLIDFTLSNSSNSGLMRTGILTQYLPLSLMDHIGTGSSWDMSARTRDCRILPPTEGVTAKDWYQGTAHAIAMNSDFVYQGNEKEILILSGDHIYHMDYRPMIQFHRDKKAIFTIATMPVAPEEAHRFGIAVTDSNNRILEFQEKPSSPKSTTGSMGIYVADRDVVLTRMKHLILKGKTDIGAHLVPSLIGEGNVYAFPFDGYWRDVGTLDSYWECSMDLLSPETSGVDLVRWNMRTNMEASGLSLRAPSRFGDCARVTESMIAQGCRIDGRVHRSVLSPGVKIGARAEVVDCVIFDDTIIGEGAQIYRAIIDKNVSIGSGARIGPTGNDVRNQLFPDHLGSGLTLLGTRSVVPAGASIAGNCLVYPNTVQSDWSHETLMSGQTLRPAKFDNG